MLKNFPSLRVFTCWKEEVITNQKQKLTLNTEEYQKVLSTDNNLTNSEFIVSELTCEAVYRWCATGTDKVALAQVMLMQCIVGWANNLISLFLCFSHSYVSHSHNSTFCLATAIPQTQLGLQRAISAQREVSMTTTLSNLHLLMHYHLKPNMVTLCPPQHQQPLLFLINSAFPTFSQQCVIALCQIRMCTQTWNPCLQPASGKRKCLWH